MATLTPELFEALPVMQEHIKKLYTSADGTWDGCGQHEFDNLATLRACAEAVAYMQNDERLERVTLSNGETRAACEVAAYYELEEFVSAA
jgi:hypothetical protein